MNQNLGRNIKRIRKLQGLLQQDLGKLARISESYIGDIETGKHYPRIKVIVRIAAALDVSLEELFKD